MIVGLDPGQEGALALLDMGGKPVAVRDMPTVKRRIGDTLRPRVDLPALRDLLAEWEPSQVVVEFVEPRKGDGPRAGWLMKSSGQAEGVVVGMRLPLIFAPPRDWRRDSGVTGKRYEDRKEASRVAARELFPDWCHMLTAKAHADRAEAMLIARWGLRARVLGFAPRVPA